jgi:hypothetical protein
MAPCFQKATTIFPVVVEIGRKFYRRERGGLRSGRFSFHTASYLGCASADRIRGRPTDSFKSFILIIYAQANFFIRFHGLKVKRLSEGEYPSVIKTYFFKGTQD